MALNKLIIGAGGAPEVLALCRRRVDEFNSVNMSTALHRIAKRPGRRQELLRDEGMAALKAGVLARVREFPARDITNIAWSCAKLALSDGPLLNAIAGQSIRRCGELIPQGLSMTAWAFATLGKRDAPLLDAIAARALPTISEFDAQSLANTSWAFATLQVKDFPLLDAMSAGSIPQIAEFSSQALANSAWSFATLGVRDEPLLHAIATAARGRIGEFTPQGLANLSWAFATLACGDERCLEAIAARAGATIGDFPLQELALTAWAFSTLSLEDAPFLDALSAESMVRLQLLQDSGACGRAVPKGVSFPDMVLCLVEALVAMDACADGLVRSAAGALCAWSAPIDGSGPPGAVAVALKGAAEGPEPRVLLEGRHAYVLWKPPGWVVNVFNESAGYRYTGAPTSRDGDLLLQQWMVERVGPDCPVARLPGAQHGVVHRLDKETSGPIVCGKSYQGYYLSRLQFAARRVRKEYVCVCHGHLEPTRRMLRAPLRVGQRQERRESADAKGARHACTEIRAVGHLLGPGGKLSLVQVRLHTGRRHQIRAHLSYEGHPLVGDAVYGSAAPAAGADGAPWSPRLFLHSYRLELDLGDDGPCAVAVPLPGDLRGALSGLRAADAASQALLSRWQGGGTA